ncbi:cell division protein FtsA [Taibaiella helva]|uniref:cell division protein FtsA n=1 Tax=Taibaiella helva TaxID=2301235 RepID=UPI000E571DFD|nr:cell division protein FtsA [Taibaiella helva]
MNRKEQPIIVGLDIGTTKVVAIAGRKNEFGKLEILGFGKADSAGVSHGVVLNIEQCIRSIEQAIDKCIQSNPNLEINEVYVGIAGQHIKSLQTRGDRVRSMTDDEITKEDIDMLIKDQYKTYIPAGDQIIDIIPQDFMIDNTPNILDPIGMSGIKVGANFHIVTGDRNAIRNIKRCVDKSGLKTNDLVLQPLASAAAVMNNEDLEAGVAIVDIGGGTTDMAVFYDGILQHTAVIPYAGTNITNDIRQGLGVLRAQAEAMKVQFGMALADEAKTNAYITIPGLRGLPPKEISVKNLAHIIQARTEEILDYVMYHLKQVNLDKRLFGGIILTGGGSQLNHLIQLTEYKTGLGARIGQPNEHLAGGHHEALNHPMYATCIGLILRGYSDFETGKLNFNSSNKEISVMKEAPSKDIFIKMELPKEGRHVEEPAAVAYETPEQRAEKQERNNKRSETIKKVFNQIKNGFMSFFEEPEDQKME